MKKVILTDLGKRFIRERIRRMSMVCRGLTHCSECMTPLEMNKFGICDNCEKEKQNKKKKENKRMNKTYKGKEIFKMIAEGEINKNTKVTVDNYGECTLGFVFEDERNLFAWLDEDFELIEENTIDIDSIEELNHYTVISAIKGKTEENINDELGKHSLVINQLVQAVKQLNKEIKELKEK